MAHETSITLAPGPASGPAATKTGVSATALAPGFSFHPTDEELVSYYLKRKVCNKPVRFDAIAEVDIYKHEPWDLSDKSRLKTREQEWYFFSPLDRKYGNGGTMNRSTNQGYWKVTAKDREVCHKGRLVGMKKKLVFHSGRAPGGVRTNWVMHEHRLVEEELERIGALQQWRRGMCYVEYFIRAISNHPMETNMHPVSRRNGMMFQHLWFREYMPGRTVIAENAVATAENAVNESNAIQMIEVEQLCAFLKEFL